MKIGLIDVDSHNFPNLALMKISAWHKSQGDTVEWNMPFDHYDIAYKSKIFTFTPDVDVINADIVKQGGTGYDLKNKLPADIEAMQPDYSIYPQYTEAYGFLTRGCPRGCKYCVVSEKEGRCSKQVADVSDFRRNRKIIKLLDPNILACKDREKLLQQLIESKAWIDFTQGLDIRFTDTDVINLLNKIKVKTIHFAWDNPKDDLTEQFIKFSELFKSKDPRKKRVYVLTNYSSTHDEDLYRINTLRKIGYDPYVMIYNKETAPRETRLLQRWANNIKAWRMCERFEDFDPRLA